MWSETFPAFQHVTLVEIKIRRWLWKRNILTKKSVGKKVNMIQSLQSWQTWNYGRAFYKNKIIRLDIQSGCVFKFCLLNKPIIKAVTTNEKSKSIFLLSDCLSNILFTYKSMWPLSEWVERKRKLHFTFQSYLQP